MLSIVTFSCKKIKKKLKVKKENILVFSCHKCEKLFFTILYCIKSNAFTFMMFFFYFVFKCKIFSLLFLLFSFWAAIRVQSLWKKLFAKVICLLITLSILSKWKCFKRNVEQQMFDGMFNGNRSLYWRRFRVTINSKVITQHVIESNWSQPVSH